MLVRGIRGFVRSVTPRSPGGTSGNDNPGRNSPSCGVIWSAANSNSSVSLIS